MKLLAIASKQPELQRQLWLEFSVTRLFAMPAVLALVFVAIALGGAGALASAALGGFLLLAWAYGARLASASLHDELTEGTWDAQRLSSLTPWQLTFGKLAGGTAFAWYGGLLCLGVWWMAESAQGRPLPLVRTLTMVAGAVAIQATSLALALASARGFTPGGKRSGGAWWVLLLLLLPWYGVLSGGAEGRAPIVWWGIAWPSAPFVATMALVFAGWAVLGAWRMMAAALQVPLRPVAWLAFLVWLAVFSGGWVEFGSAPWRIASLLAVIASTAAYATLFLEPPRIDAAQRLAARWRETGWSRATQQRLPLMAASTALSLAAGLAAAVLALLGGFAEGAAGAFGTLGGLGDQAGRGGVGLREAFAGAGLAAGAPLALALLTLRDMALACALHWGRDVRRAEGATLVLLVVVNLLLPWFLLTAGLPMLAGWVQPALGMFGMFGGGLGTADGGLGGGLGGGITALLAAALQAAAAMVWALQRWRGARAGSGS